jgi:pimeloyl-ACP methyl ester carboxylesterase
VIEHVKLEIDRDIPEPTSTGSLWRHELMSARGRRYDLNTYYVKPAGETKETDRQRSALVVLQPFSDFVERPFQQARLNALSDWTGRDVVGIDNPGVGLTTSNLALGDAWRLGRGNRDDMTDLQWQALAETLGDDKDTTRLTLSYFSLGASAAAAMTANAPEWAAGNIDQVVLWDSAAPVDIAFGRLAYRYARYGGDGWAGYTSENPEWMPDPSSIRLLIGRILQQPVGHAAYPFAMSATSVMEHLQRANDRDITPRYAIINGSESRVSPTAENDELANRLRRFAGSSAVSRTIFEGEKHGVQDSIPRTKAALPYWHLK